MFDNTNSYTLRTEEIEGITHYFVSFKDGQAITRETEVSRPVYLEFCRFVRCERNLRRSDERHTEQSEVTDETLYKRALHPPKSVEETAVSNEMAAQLHAVIAELPDIQRRRFLFYYEIGLTYEQISEIEGCTKRAVKFSVDIAKEKVLEKIKNF